MDFGKYLAQLDKTKFSEVSCAYCAHAATSPDGKEAICDFCENYVNAAESEFTGDAETKTVLLEVHDLIGKNQWDEAEKKITKLLDDTMDARLLYVCAAFYKYVSDYHYYAMDYGLRGFMHENADNVRESVELAAKSKACLYKALKVINIETSGNRLLHVDLLYIKFMSYIKLNRLVEAKKTLNEMVGLKNQDLLNAYAEMVYDVESNSKNAIPSVMKLLARNEVNAFYYLAKCLARTKRSKEAKAILEKALAKAGMPFSVPLMRSMETEMAHYV